MRKSLFNIIVIIISLSVFSCKDVKSYAIESNKQELNTINFDSIKSIMEIVYNDDLKYRYEIEKIESEFGKDSNELIDLWEKIDKQDSINLVKVTSIINKYGWLGVSEIGEDANYALYSVIQHSDLETQLNYFPILEKACENGKASKKQYAYFKDRILVRQGKKQIYGTQYQWDEKENKYYPLSIIEPEKINERRAEVGLISIEEFYLYNWNIEWNLEQYKEWIKRIEK